jgi:D-alanyl-D-alanine carboxypeptidase
MKKSHLFTYSLLFSLPLWWGINVFGIGMDNYFMDREIVKNPYILKAQISFFVSLPKASGKLEIGAKSAVSVLIKPNGEKEVIFSKNADERLAIASLTKLMSAYVVLNNLDLEKEITVLGDSLLSKGIHNGFLVGQTFKAKDVLYTSMIESSNDGITVLTQPFGLSTFVNLMNMEAKHLGLSSTEFFNPTGLDPDDLNSSVNYSTASDLAILAEKILQNPIASEALSLKEFDLYDINGIFNHKSITTNNILLYPAELNGLEIIGGKTGETPIARGCLLLVVKNTRGDALINVILSSDDRFGEMVKLANWANAFVNYKRVLELFD